MGTYVDKGRSAYRGMLMCHMFADTLDELHAMADKIGVARRHFQQHPRLPHYDVCQAKRALAVRNGATEVDRRFVVDFMRQSQGGKS